MRSASDRWAIEKIVARGLPSGVWRSAPTSSGSPSSQASKPGAARRLLSRVASSKRSFAGKKASRSSAPTLVIGGVWICWMSPGRSRSRPVSPRGLEEAREQDVLPALERVRLDAEESEEARGGGADALAEELGVVAQGGGRSRERLDDRDRKPRRAAGRVDGDVGGVAQPPDPRAVLSPRRQPLPPELGLLRGVCLDREPLPTRVVLVDPRGEVLRAELREGEAEVREVALRVDEEHGDAVEQRLLDEREAEARLAAARHPDADRVGDEVLRVVEEEARAGLLGAEVVRAARGRRRRASRSRRAGVAADAAAAGARSGAPGPGAPLDLARAGRRARDGMDIPSVGRLDVACQAFVAGIVPGDRRARGRRVSRSGAAHPSSAARRADVAETTRTV